MRVLAVGLDGCEIGYVDDLVEQSCLPTLAKLRATSARFLLDHGAATRTGLAWEHFATGMTPSGTGRETALEFDPSRYSVTQTGARRRPFFAGLDRRVVVFDAPYTDLTGTSNTTGIVGWGAHDAGVIRNSSPRGLVADLDARFGAYPSSRWTYATPWPSRADTAAMGRGLVDGIHARTGVTGALLAEHEWDLAIIVSGEAHSASEGLWHGIAPDHPLAGHPSAPSARDAMRDVYEALDGMVESLVARANADAVVVFSMNGMGTNNADLPSMVLLPELVFRWATGERFLELPTEWTATPDAPPWIDAADTWDAALGRCYPAPHVTMKGRVARVLPAGARRARLRRARRTTTSASLDLGVGWIPASRYRGRWPEMRAFALPAMYDGRIRINVRGRESQGLVDPSDYRAVGDELEELVRSCRDPRTGAPVVAKVDRHADPFAVPTSDGDLVVTWGGSCSAFDHPTHGLIGPVPYRRTGGHTGPYGFAYVQAPDIAPGDRGVRSSFDVTPTLVDLLGHPQIETIEGTSLLDMAVTSER